MPPLKNEIVNNQSSKASKVALKVFFNIMMAWRVSEKDQMNLIDQPSRIILNQWQHGIVAGISNETYKRISYVIGIYKSLHLLFQNKKQADGWMLRPNSTFGGDSGLEFILKDSLTNLSFLRRYLELQTLR